MKVTLWIFLIASVVMTNSQLLPLLDKSVSKCIPHKDDPDVQALVKSLQDSDNNAIREASCKVMLQNRVSCLQSEVSNEAISNMERRGIKNEIKMLKAICSTCDRPKFAVGLLMLTVLVQLLNM